MRNIEAKFRLSSLADAQEVALRFGYTVRTTLRQRDTFFKVAHGKLKLREEETSASLIFYRREGEGALMHSDYEIVPIGEPERTRAILADAIGVLAEVRKERLLMTRDNVRLHLDRVEGLGAFGEIEAVLHPDSSVERSGAAVNELLDALGIARDELIAVSYFELMLARDVTPR